MGERWTRARRRAVPLAAALAAAATLAACAAPRFGAPEPVEEGGERILSLWKAAVMTALAVGALVWLLIAFVVVRYRRRRRQEGQEGVPDQRSEHVPLEVFYTAVPLVIVAVLFGLTVATEERVTDTSDRPDLVVEVLGFQWQWQFRYPREGVVITGTLEEPPTLVLPVGATVRLRLASTDVAHAFWVPRFLSKRDLIPGVRNEIDVRVRRPGRWTGRCAEFCGLDHYRMNFAAEAVPQAEFRRWVEEQRAQRPTTGPSTTVGGGGGSL